MGAKYTNVHNLPLSICVWLAEDTYQHVDDPKHISATGLLKPIKQIILSKRVPESATVVDISTKLASKLGTAVHDSIENAWKNNYKQSLKDMGYPPGLINTIRINPDDPNEEDITAVYLETRTNKEFMGFIISGEFDFCGDGMLEDFKSTGTYTYTKQTSADKYVLQCSIYRWLNPDIVKDDTFGIDYIFKDWMANLAKGGGNYPSFSVMQEKHQLMSVEETEAWIRRKLEQIIKYADSPEEDIPACTDEDLWRSDPVWKYYKNPANAAKKGGRSTKNFDNQLEAQMRYTEDGSVGAVIEVKGEVKACKYCPAAAICKQKDAYIADGSLKI